MALETTQVQNSLKAVGPDHDKTVDLPLPWQMRLTLYRYPFIVGSVTILLIAVFWIIGLCGISGIYPLYLGIVIALIGIIISAMETLLVQVCIRSSICLKGIEHYYEKSGQDIKKFGYYDNMSQLYVDEYFGEFDLRLIPLTAGKRIVLFFGFFLLNLSFMLIFWGLSIIRMEFNPPVWYVYLVVDMLIGVASPILFTSSIYFIANVGRYVTRGRMRVESMIPAFLTFVKYEWESDTSTYPYWKIVDYFNFIIYPKEHHSYNLHIKKKLTIPFNLASWCLNSIVCVTFCLSVTYIVGQLLTGEQLVFSCGEVNGEGFDCFEHTSNEYINCTDDDGTKKELDCYRFNQVGIHSDPIGVIITALFLYLACEKFLTIMFKFVKEIFKIHPSRLWGIGVSGFGLFLLTLSVVCSIVYDRVHSVYFDFQKLLQLYIISIDIFLSGVLLLNVRYRNAKDKNA